VCILARDSGYLNHTFPNLTWDFNAYRNSNIETYKAAAEYLASKNIITFRMGNNVDRPFPAGNTKLVIDYANSAWRTDKIDIFLAMKCFFFISSGSGLDAIQIATRRPLLGVNIAQPLHIIKSKRNYLFILKYFFHETSNIFLSPCNYYNIGNSLGFTVDNPLHLRSLDIERLGIKIIDNTSSEIKDATVEMYDMLTNKDAHKSELSERQMEFWEKFPNISGVDNFGPPLSRVGEKFLEQNPWLIE
jgi:putative glycosyltransferase (TIGR04372 family)